MSTSLLSIFPNSNDLLALAPEELGGVIFELTNELRGRNGNFTLETFRDQLYALNERAYPISVQRKVLLALAEALAWLQSQGLIVGDPEQSPGSFVTTKRAQAFRTRADVEAFTKGRVLPIELLQPALAEKVWPQLLRGDHDVAVFQAFKEVEVAVRKAANLKGAQYPDDLVGIALMRKAFHPDTGPLRDAALVTAEREAEMHLFSGAIGHAKNPTSHRDVCLSTQMAARLIAFSSHLLDIVEQRLV